MPYRPRPTLAQRRKAQARAEARSAALATLAPAALALLAVYGAWHMVAPMLTTIGAALSVPMP